MEQLRTSLGAVRAKLRLAAFSSFPRTDFSKMVKLLKLGAEIYTESPWHSAPKPSG